MAKKRGVVTIRKPTPPPKPVPIPDPVQFLRDTGILFHINCTVFHPLGLGLVLENDSFHIMDYREQPSWVFSAEDFKTGKAKLEFYMEEIGKTTMNRRNDLIGIITQKLLTVKNDNQSNLGAGKPFLVMENVTEIIAVTRFWKRADIDALKIRDLKATK